MVGLIIPSYTMLCVHVYYVKPIHYEVHSNGNTTHGMCVVLLSYAFSTTVLSIGASFRINSTATPNSRKCTLMHVIVTAMHKSVLCCQRFAE